MSNPTTRYNKPARSPADLLAHLQRKGLVISSEPEALKSLQYIGYYRLLIYMRPLQDSSKNFIPGTTFEQIINLYNFDRKLRLHCLDAIEKIEVALRATIINTLSLQDGPHFYTESRQYADLDGYKEFMAAALKAKYLAIQHYYKNYNTPSPPPIWAIMEAITFGTLSRFYSNLHLDNKKKVASEFGYDREILVSWFRSLNNIRNMCAHHNRLWNFQLRVDTPKIAKALQSEFPPAAAASSFCARAVVMTALLRKIDPTTDWHIKLKELISTHHITSQTMGFPVGWESRSFWT